MRREIDRKIIKLAFPAILSNITVPLLGLSDTWISGHLGSELYLAAIAVGAMMVNALYWLLGFLRAGTAGLSAEAYGAGDEARRRDIFTSSFLLATLLGIAICLLSYPLCELMLYIMHPAPETASLAKEYFMISVFAAPALLATMTVSGWMIGSQNTLYPMIIAISVNVINIALSFSLVFWMHTGFHGVAVGTLSANWLGLAIALILARVLAKSHGNGKLWSRIKGLGRRMDMRRYFKVNSNLMLRSACIMAVTFAMTSYGGRMGNVTLAINAIIMQLFLFFSYFSDGFAYAAEALCGKYAGAKDRVGMKCAIKRLFLWCGVVAMLFLIAYGFFVRPISLFLTDELVVVDGVARYVWVLCAIPLLSAAAFLLDGVFIGLTETRKMLVATFAAAVAFFAISLSVIFVGNGVITPALNSMIWTSFLVFLALRSILLGLYLRHDFKKEF